jgi:ABC-type uncharacterized transport system, permease component
MGVKRILKLFAFSAKLDLMWFLRDTKFALTAMAADAISNLSAVSGMLLIAVRFGGIGGMSTDEILFMMAYSTLVTGLFIIFGAGNNFHISRIIGRGQLEHLFMQPLSLPVQLLTSGFAPFTGGSNFIVGIIMTVIAVQRMHLQISIGWIMALLGSVLVTLATIVARSYLVSSITFYAPVAAEEISTTAIEETWFLSTFPLSGMPKFIQIPLLTFLPEGLMAWFPAMCLLGKPPFYSGQYYPLFFALLLSLAAGYFFQKGMRYYIQKGANRYVPYGYRR